MAVGVAYLGGHDEFVVDDIVWSEPHSEEGTGRVEVTGHARPAVHILTDALGGRGGIHDISSFMLEKRENWEYLYKL